MKISTFFPKVIMLFSLMMILQVTSSFASDFIVKFIRVEADQVDQRVLVRWVTDSEIDNDFFTVQRSVDGGLNWQVLGDMEGSGNTPGAGVYSFIDEIPEEGLNLYRIQQTDLDGAYTYSYKASVEFTFFTGEEDTEVQVYPNPTSEVVMVESDSEFSENVSVELMDLSGKLISVNTESNNKIISIRPIQQLSGLYFLMINDRNKRTIKKINFK